MANEVFLLGAVRSPIGAMNGALVGVGAPQLAAACIKAAVERSKAPADSIDEVIMGNVVAAGLGQNPARQAAIFAGLSPSIGATTVNKVCGSGLKAVALAAQAIRLGDSGVVVAGGMENMSRAPYLLMKARQGYRMGNGELIDGMIHDGLWDVYGQKHMGTLGDKCAAKYGFSKQAQDEFAVQSYLRARKAQAEGLFTDEIVPIEIKEKNQVVVVAEDEGPKRFQEEKLKGLRPAFAAEGTITAGNASSINDGAAALILASDQKAAALGLKPLARVVGAATFSQEPDWFTTAPVGALRKLLDRIGWSVEQTDLFEINEAFAVVVMAAMKELHIPHDKVNIHGGAIALGHPIGCSGARVLVTLLHALRQKGKRRGVACLCIGGGEAIALAVETV